MTRNTDAAWSWQDDAYLARLQGELEWEAIARALGRPVEAVLERTIRLRLDRSSDGDGRRSWTPAQEALLARVYPPSDWSWLEQLLGRSRQAIAGHVHAQQRRRAISTKVRPWSAEDDALLARLFPVASWSDLLARLGRSRSAVVSRAHRLGLRRKAVWTDVRCGWSPAEDALLQDYATADWADLSEALDRSPRAIEQRAAQLGLDRPPDTRAGWTPEKDARLVQQFATAGWDELLREFGRSQRTIERRAAQLGLRRPEYSARWTAEEDDWLRQHYATTGTIEQIARLGRSPASIYTRARRLGLQRRLAESWWTAEEDAWLLRHFGRLGWPELLRKLGRTQLAIASRAQRLGLRRAGRGVRQKRRWSAEEEAWLVEHYASTDWRERLRALGPRSRSAIAARAAKLGLRPPGADPGEPTWSAEEDAWLAEHYATTDWPELVRTLGRPQKVIYRHARRIGLSRPRGAVRRWSTEEDELLRQQHASTSMHDLVLLLGRGEPGITQRLQAPGLRHPRHRRRRGQRRRRWRPEEDVLLAQHYVSMSWQELQRILDQTRAAIFQRASKLGLPRRPPGRNE